MHKYKNMPKWKCLAVLPPGDNVHYLLTSRPWEGTSVLLPPWWDHLVFDAQYAEIGPLTPPVSEATFSCVISKLLCAKAARLIASPSFRNGWQWALSRHPRPHLLFPATHWRPLLFPVSSYLLDLSVSCPGSSSVAYSLNNNVWPSCMLGPLFHSVFSWDMLSHICWVNCYLHAIAG